MQPGTNGGTQTSPGGVKGSARGRGRRRGHGRRRDRRLAAPAGATPVTAHGAKWVTEHFRMNTSTSPTSNSGPLIAYGVFTAAGTDGSAPNSRDTQRLGGVSDHMGAFRN